MTSHELPMALDIGQFSNLTTSVCRRCCGASVRNTIRGRNKILFFWNLCHCSRSQETELYNWKQYIPNSHNTGQHFQCFIPTSQDMLNNGGRLCLLSELSSLLGSPWINKKDQDLHLPTSHDFLLALRSSVSKVGKGTKDYRERRCIHQINAYLQSTV